MADGVNSKVYIERLAADAREASGVLAHMSSMKKNEVLRMAAQALERDAGRIVEANQKDVRAARLKGLKESLIDRLCLTKERVQAMADALADVAALPDPIGEVISMTKRPNGLVIGKKRVPIGVVGMIYEARPNVTADAFALCFKTGNAVILKGGSDAIASNQAIVESLSAALDECGLPSGCLRLVERTDREATIAMMQASGQIDVLIPRGGADLIRTVVQNSTVPVIETGTGNCHVYVDASADADMAEDIIENAKTQRLGVCNACESLVIHEKALPLLPGICRRLIEHGVELRGDGRAQEAVPAVIPAGEDDWGREYLDSIISIRVVDSIDEAIRHINTYGTGHSEAIVTSDYENAMRFHEEIDAAAVYVNASIRFTDGYEFGFGAEIGISTQKLHVRGPMGLEALTTTKYIIFGSGQIRP